MLTVCIFICQCFNFKSTPKWATFSMWFQFSQIQSPHLITRHCENWLRHPCDDAKMMNSKYVSCCLQMCTKCQAFYRFSLSSVMVLWTVYFNFQLMNGKKILQDFLKFEKFSPSCDKFGPELILTPFAKPTNFCATIFEEGNGSFQRIMENDFT